MSRESLPAFLSTWRQQFQEELRTNSRGIIGRKLTKLAKEVPDSFPDIDILPSYTNPIMLGSLGCAVEKNLKLTWSEEPDVGKLAALCEFYFEWGYREAILERNYHLNVRPTKHRFSNPCRLQSRTIPAL
ncbi:hypothetical protein JOM56_015483 [Amanita muscaria]